MNKIHTILITLLFTAASFFTGCTTTKRLSNNPELDLIKMSPSSAGIILDGHFPSSGYMNIPANDTMSSTYGFKITSITGNTVNDIRQIQIQLISTRNRVADLEYRIDWFDTNNLIIKNTATGWTALPLIGKTTKSISSSSKSTQAFSFKIQIRKKKS